MGMEAAVMALVGSSAIGYVMADGEKARLRFVRAMRRSLIHMHERIRYEQPSLAALLAGINLNATPEERQLSTLLHACSERISRGSNPQLVQVFGRESRRLAGYAVLGKADRCAFESVLAELGRTGMSEQLRLISAADERLRQREEEIAAECQVRARLIRTLGVTAGAAAFMLLV